MDLSRKQYFTGLLFVLPALAIFLLFFYVPILQSFYYSTTRWDGMGKPEYIGLDNFRYLWEDPRMKNGLLNSLKMVVFGIVVQNPLALTVAVLLNRKFRTKAWIRTSFYLPVVISLVVASVVWGQLLQYEGFINQLLSQIGLGAIAEDWLGTMRTAFPTIIALSQWQAIGYCAVIYLAGLQAIPADMYEAAEMEGAEGFKLFRYVTFPLLMPSVSIVMFLTVVGGLKLFELPYILTNGGPGTSSYTLFMAIYSSAFREGNYGYAIAGSVVLTAMIIIVSTIQLRITRRREVEL